MLNDLNHLYTDKVKMDKAVDKAKALFNARELYTLYPRLDEDILIFDTIFIQKIRYALTSMNTKQMTKRERQLLEDMIIYQNSGRLFNRNNTSAGNLASLLDDYLSQSIYCTTVESNFEEHTWKSCEELREGS